MGLLKSISFGIFRSSPLKRILILATHYLAQDLNSLGLSAGKPTSGFSRWFGHPHSMAAVFREWWSQVQAFKEARSRAAGAYRWGLGLAQHQSVTFHWLSSHWASPESGEAEQIPPLKRVTKNLQSYLINHSKWSQVEEKLHSLLRSESSRNRENVELAYIRAEATVWCWCYPFSSAWKSDILSFIFNS